MEFIEEIELYSGEVYRLVEEGGNFKIMRNFQLLYLTPSGEDAKDKWKKLKRNFKQDGQVKTEIQ